MKINVKKVLLGGIVAGAVISAIDVLMYAAILKKPMAAAWSAAGRPTMSEFLRSIEVPASISLDFVAGVFLMWLYAAIRPRYGAGPRTALQAGIAGWFFASVLATTFTVQGIMPSTILLITVLVLLLEYPLAVVVGARFYAEGDARG